MWRSIKIWLVMLAVCSLWAFCIGPWALKTIGAIPTSIISFVVGGTVSLVGFKVKAWLDAEDARFRRYERKIVNEMRDIMEEDKD